MKKNVEDRACPGLASTVLSAHRFRNANNGHPCMRGSHKTRAKRAKVIGRIDRTRAAPRRYFARCPSGSALLAFTSPSEKLVCRSFTFGRFIKCCRAKAEKPFRSCATTCNSKVPVPLM